MATHDDALTLERGHADRVEAIFAQLPEKASVDVQRLHAEMAQAHAAASIAWSLVASNGEPPEEGGR